MIEITRRLAREARNVVRRSLMTDSPRCNWPMLHLRTDGDGLHLRATRNGSAVLYDDPRPRPAHRLAFKAAALTAFAGPSADKVTLAAVAGSKIEARWLDGGVPQTVALGAVAPVEDDPLELPRRFTPMPAQLLSALAAAARTSAKSAVKPALTQVLLRGGDGAVVATDGKQLLLQQGFPFPWKDAVLVPRLAVFEAPELAEHAGTLAVGRTRQHVGLRMGPWTLLLPIDEHHRFPDFQSSIPDPQRIRSRLRLADADAAFLLKTIPKLPPSEDETQAVTLDLGTPPMLRVQGRKDDITELDLHQSQTSGRPMRFCMDRRLLYRAVQLGFRELEIVTGDAPVVCRNDQRVYLFMPLGENEALPPKFPEERSRTPQIAPPEERKEIMPAPEQNGRHEPVKNGHAPVAPNGDRVNEQPSFENLIDEAVALRNLLGSAAQRAARLTSALKQHRRQSRVVRTAIDSLRELRLGP